ncbi:MAG: tetratricopeptide repeat protein [bacterium]
MAKEKRGKRKRPRRPRRAPPPYMAIEKEGDLVKGVRSGRDVVEQMVANLSDPSEEVQRSSIHILGMERGRHRGRAIRALRRYIIDPEKSDDLKKEAVSALVNLGALREGHPIQAHIGGKLIDLALELVPIGDVGYNIEAMKHFSRGVEYSSRGDDQKAVEEYERAIAIDPSMVEAYNNLANAYRRQGDDERATPLLEKAISIDPEYADAHLNLGATYMDAERNEEAMEHLLKAMELGLETAEAYGKLGEFFLWLNELQHAEASLKRSLEMEDDLEVRKELYMVLVAQRKEEEAQRWKRGIPKSELEKLTARGSLLGGISILRKMADESNARKRKRKLRKPISLMGTLRDFLMAHTNDDLRAIAKFLGIPLSRIKKDIIVEQIGEALRDPWTIDSVIERLSEKEREALKAVMDRGGWIDYDELTKKFGNEEKDSPYWIYKMPESTVGGLRLAGILYTGTAELDGKGSRVAIVPEEIRHIISSALSRA